MFHSLFLCCDFQAGYFINVDSSRFKYVYHSIFTFGLNHVCVKEHLGAGLHILIESLGPAILFLLTVAMWSLTHFSWFPLVLQFFQKRKSFLHVWWLVVLYSYTLVALAMFGPLRCVYISGAGEWRHRTMGTRCFEGHHLVLFIIGVIGVVFLDLLLPLLLFSPRVRSVTRLKELIDEAVHIYRDDMNWWLSVNIGRRTLLPFITLLTSISAREVSMTGYFSLLLLIHVTYK